MLRFGARLKDGWFTPQRGHDGYLSSPAGCYVAVRNDIAGLDLLDGKTPVLMCLVFIGFLRRGVFFSTKHRPACLDNVALIVLTKIEKCVVFQKNSNDAADERWTDHDCSRRSRGDIQTLVSLLANDTAELDK
jgi:hypothetical protein